MMKRIRSFGYAINGLTQALKDEANLRFHVFSMIVVVGLGYYIDLLQHEWLILMLTIGFVVSAELLNTAIENLCDHVTQGRHPMIKKVKDISAAAVLISALSALVIGILIFGPRLLLIFFK